jgi:hypothetical protein
MLKNFRTYQLSINFYQLCRQTSLPAFLKNQLLRASSSISLNLAEGSSRPVGKGLPKNNFSFWRADWVQIWTIRLNETRGIPRRYVECFVNEERSKMGPRCDA